MSASAAGLEFESVPVNLFEGENQEDWYVALHPASKVPVIDDDGFVLFESNAIMKYLCPQGGIRVVSLRSRGPGACRSMV